MSPSPRFVSMCVRIGSSLGGEHSLVPQPYELGQEPRWISKKHLADLELRRQVRVGVGSRCRAWLVMALLAGLLKCFTTGIP